jgi:RNA 2',3'-cyclic 3'-phosphodiesterase
MRIFTAIALPQKTKALVAEVMRGRLPVSYVNTTNLHMTLNFLGELSDDKIEKAKDVFLKATADQKGFFVEFDKVQKFRSQIHITVRMSPDLKVLQEKMATEFVASGFSLENREYYPHVKLANLHYDQVLNPGRKLEMFPNSELSKLNFQADKVALFSSKLLLHHAHHEIIMESKLE